MRLAMNVITPSMKLPISALPLVPKSQSLQHNLVADPLTPSHTAFENILKSKPSVQRRSRLVDSGSHFSFVTPFHHPFPFRIELPENDPEVERDRHVYIEKWLSSREALNEIRTAEQHIGASLIKFSGTKDRPAPPPRTLIGLAEQAINDCLPHLDVGDAFSHMYLDQYPLRNDSSDNTEKLGSIREELIDVLSGYVVLMSHSSKVTKYGPYLPWSLRYCGHQFGQWAGQLGDGRAISIMEVPHPSIEGLAYEIQLKGAGRTPYSRSADGLAVLRSSIREFLCAEAIHALKIPTTRSLSIVHVPDVSVEREQVETAAVVARMAPSFIRIGSFQAHNPPEEVFFIGMPSGGGQQPNYEGMRILGEWVANHVLKLERKDSRAPWGKELVWESAIRNAKMVAGWQAYGFMHGVMNTDNISIMGLTIDYGPYAFMDVYDKDHICNHTDQLGRYAFKYQPTMIVYAMRALLTALSPVIGAEMETGHAVVKDWAINASKDTVGDWQQKTKELQSDLDQVIQETFQAEYWMLMRKRLGLLSVRKSDESEVIQPLLNLMEEKQLDFHRTLRSLSEFTISESDADMIRFATIIMSFSPRVAFAGDSNLESVQEWLQVYRKRIAEEKDAWFKFSGDGWQQARKDAMNNVNPRFVLRQWVLEEVIKKVQENPTGGRQLLHKVMEMATHPFDPWGAEQVDELLPRQGDRAQYGDKEERRLCGLGSEDFLGFQCSCSS